MRLDHPRHRVIAKLIFAAIILVAIAVVVMSIYGAFGEKVLQRGSAGPLSHDLDPSRERR